MNTLLTSLLLASVFANTHQFPSFSGLFKPDKSHWWNPPDTSQMILENGYPVEVHDVTTEDGYILSMFRIPHGRHDKPSSDRPPLLLQHGILCSSDCWLFPIPEKGLGYVLADAGYDVWLGNNRGTSYSQRHVNMTTSDKKFWDFSFHELGYYDVPAMIDYIIENTGAPKVSYVGHSQGTTQFFALTSSRPEYNSKILISSHLAPIAYLDGAEGGVAALAKISKYVAKFARLVGITHVFGHSLLINGADHLFCRSHAITRPICDNLIYFFSGFDAPQLNKTLVEQIGEYSASATSIKQLEHFAQLTDNGIKFTQYDYGSDANVKHYGTPMPPEYDLTQVTAPVSLHYSDNDFLARPKNVMKMAGLMKNVVAKIKVPYEKFSHIDFTWAKDVDVLVNKDVLRILKSYL